MQKKISKINFDFVGAVTAAVCALHCTIFPILLSLGLTGASHHSHTFDFGMMAIGISIAAYVLLRDLIKNHKSFIPLFVCLFGFAVLFYGIESHGEYFYLNILGGLLVIVSHFINWNLSKKSSVNPQSA